MKNLTFTQAVTGTIVFCILSTATPVWAQLTAYNNYDSGISPWSYTLSTSYTYNHPTNGGSVSWVSDGSTPGGAFPAGNSAFGGCARFVPLAGIYHHDYDSVIWNDAEGTWECWIAPAWNGENQGGNNPDAGYQDLLIGDGVDEWNCTQGFNLFLFDNADPPTPGYQFFLSYKEVGGTQVNYDNYALGNTLDWIAGQWHHICVSWDASEIMVGIDGLIFYQSAPVTGNGYNYYNGGYMFEMGRASGPTECFDGWVDDIAVWNEARYTGYTGTYPVPTLPAQYSPQPASNPKPWDNEKGIHRFTDLSWTSVPGMITHKVYFDTTEINVQNRTVTPIIVTAPDSNCPVPLDYLTPKTTYYWAVDEIDSAANTYTGNVWKFTTERKAIPALIGDLGRDYKVDFKDIAIFASQYLDDISPWDLLCSELDNAVIVDNKDFALLANNFSESDIPLGFKVLGTIVPPEYESPPTYGFTEVPPSTHTDYYRATPEELTRGYLVYVKNYLDNIYPVTTPQSLEVTSQLSAFSAPGEYEPVTFTIYSMNDMDDVSVTVSNLTGPAGAVIESSNIEVRSVRCWPRLHWTNPASYQYMIRPWFLEKRDTLDIPANNSKRYWITVWVPADAKAGSYNGTVSINVSNRANYSLSLSLDVLDIQLLTPPTQQCIYYHLADETNPVSYQPYPDEYYYKEVINMKEHLLNGVMVMIPVDFSGHMEGSEAVYDLDPIAPFMDSCTQAGFDSVIWNMTISQFLDGPSGNYGVNIRGFVDSCLARSWDVPILSYGDESDATGGEATVNAWLSISKSYVPEAKTYTTIVYPWNSELFEPHLDIRAFALPDWRVVEPTRIAGKKLWQYSGAGEDTKQGRFYRGIWGKVLGLEGMLDWLYFHLYYYDKLYDDLAKLAVHGANGPTMRGYVFPGQDGPLPSPAWEGLREGAEDDKYLYTLAALIKKANDSGDPTAIALAASAQSYLDSLYDQVDDIPEYVMGGTFPHVAVCNTITDLDFFDDFRLVIAGHIEAITDALNAMP